MSSVRRPHGRLFQICGPAAPKLLSPKLLCVRGTAHMLSEEDRRDRRLPSETRWISSAMVAVNGVVVRSRTRNRHCQATTLGKLFTPMCLDLFTKQYNLVPCKGFHVNAPYVAANGMKSNEQGEYCRSGSAAKVIVIRSFRLEPLYKLSTLLFFTFKPSRYITSHPGQLSLAILLWVVKMSSMVACNLCGEVKASCGCLEHSYLLWVQLFTILA